MGSMADNVSKEIVDKINKIFQSESPAPLVKVLEAFVSLLRNNPKSKPVDVELFFADAAKLSAKMKRVKTTDCDLELVTNVAENLEGEKSNFASEHAIDGIEIGEFKVFLDWSINFCRAAKIDLRVSKTR